MSFFLKGVFLGLALVSAAQPALCAHTDYRRLSTERLIDQLRKVDEQIVGVDASASFDGFIATTRSPRFRGGLLGTLSPDTPPQLRELVRRGVTAVPNLLAHLNDARSTRLSIPAPPETETFGGMYYAMEYDARKTSQTTKPPLQTTIRRKSTAITESASLTFVL